jgi:hypothetical protein
MMENLQEIFTEYNRMSESVLQGRTEDIREKQQLLRTIRSLQEGEDTHLSRISALETELWEVQKTNHEFSELIKRLEDTVAETQSEQIQENKFDMLRMQAKELTDKDREIERLNKLILHLKTQAQLKRSHSQDIIGFSPTHSDRPKEAVKPPSVLDLVMKEVENTEHDELIVTEVEPKTDVADVADVADVEPTVVESEETEEEEVVEAVDTEEEEDVEEVVEEVETVVYRKKEYLILTGDTEPIVYRKEGETRGPRVGVWGTTKSGKKKVVLDT